MPLVSFHNQSSLLVTLTVLACAQRTHTHAHTHTYTHTHANTHTHFFTLCPCSRIDPCRPCYPCLCRKLSLTRRCVRACVCACVRACVYMCVYEYVCVVCVQSRIYCIWFTCFMLSFLVLHVFLSCASCIQLMYFIHVCLTVAQVCFLAQTYWPMSIVLFGFLQNIAARKHRSCKLCRSVQKALLNKS